MKERLERFFGSDCRIDAVLIDVFRRQSSRRVEKPAKPVIDGLRSDKAKSAPSSGLKPFLPTETRQTRDGARYERPPRVRSINEKSPAQTP